MKAAATKRLVLDASVAIAWCVDDESNALSEDVLDLLASGGQAVVPAIWPVEVANALLVAERRKRITTAQVTAQLGRIARLPILVEPTPPDRAFGAVLATARHHQLAEYDAAYLELALREGIPLATLDGDLKRAARGMGIKLID